jgi:hypothetical protein
MADVSWNFTLNIDEISYTLKLMLLKLQFTKKGDKELHLGMFY